MIQSILCVLFAVCSLAAAQPESVPVAAAPDAAVVTEAAPLVARWEGLPCEGDRCAAYLDTIAVPPVWTICHGETDGVRAGEVRTRAECRAGLVRGLNRYWVGLRSFFSAEALARRLPPRRGAAYLSLAWNVGVAGTGRSTAVRRLNEGDIRGGCEAITWWNRAGGRVIRGLANRRAEEFAYCVEGLP